VRFRQNRSFPFFGCFLLLQTASLLGYFFFFHD